MTENDDDSRLKTAARTLQELEPKPFEDFHPKPMPAPVNSAPESVFGGRVQAARSHFGLSVDALSRLTKATDKQGGRGVSATALLRYESGDALPGARELRLLCQSLGVSSDWLIFGRTMASTVSAAEEHLLVAMRNLHREHAHRRELGEQIAMTLDEAERRERAQLIEQAKRRP
jgi:transcriptional regulator with XRE-family HTH domain